MNEREIVENAVAALIQELESGIIAKEGISLQSVLLTEAGPLRDSFQALLDGLLKHKVRVS